mgnify:CR=1 FL=1
MLSLDKAVLAFGVFCVVAVAVYIHVAGLLG